MKIRIVKDGTTRKPSMILDTNDRILYQNRNNPTEVERVFRQMLREGDEAMSNRELVEYFLSAPCEWEGEVRH